MDGLVRVPRTLGTELPDSPAVAVASVEEGYEAIQRVAVGALWVCLGGAGSAVQFRVCFILELGYKVLLLRGTKEGQERQTLR